jgi:hypothetical protein
MGLKLKILSIFLVILTAVVTIPLNTVQATPDYFTIAVLPDTQFYSRDYPEIFNQQAQWIVDNAQTQNIVFVAHLGDLINDYSVDSQWQNARAAMGIIRAADIPYSVVPGNHDINFAAGDPTKFDTWFPYTDFTSYSWYGGHYPENSNTSNFELFSAMDHDFIVLNLVCSGSLLTAATEWANAVLTQYSDRKAIVVTHGYINTSGGYSSGANTAGLEIRNNIVKNHANVVAVFCGHNAGQLYTTDTGISGNTIYNLLTDYQDLPDGGNGWLRLYQFYPRLNQIRAVTYSSYLDQYDTSTYAQFELYLDMGGEETPDWDLNGDHVCDVCDLAALGYHWSQTGSPGWIAEDLNQDGVIDICDLAALGYHWMESW